MICPSRIAHVQFDCHGARVLRDIVGNAGDRSMKRASWIRRHAEGGLLALADAGCVCFRNRNHEPQTVEIFDLDNRLCTGAPDAGPTSAPE